MQAFLFSWTPGYPWAKQNAPALAGAFFIDRDRSPMPDQVGQLFAWGTTAR